MRASMDERDSSEYSGHEAGSPEYSGHEPGPPEESGHEPRETHDRAFAPVNQGSDARGRTRPGTPVPHHVPDGDDAEADDGDLSGTGTPGVEREHPDTLPADERGVEAAERHDDTR